MSSKKKRIKKNNKHRELDRVENYSLFPAYKNIIGGKIYGYINSKGVFIIEPKFNMAYDFNEYGIAIVDKNNLTGAINSKGEFVIKPIYESITPFKEGRAIYVLNNKMGVMDEKGNSITKKDYNFIGQYNNGLAVIGVNKNNEYYYGYIDRDGNEVVEPKLLIANDFKENVALVKLKEREYGLIDKEGKILYTYNYDFVGEYGEGLMVYSDTLGGPYGYIDKEGKIIIKRIFTTAQGFEGGLAVVSTSDGFNGPYGAVNSVGDYIYKPVYTSIKVLKEERVSLGMPLGDNKIITSSIYAIADNKGNTLTDFKYLAVGNYEEGKAYASDSMYTFFINLDGQIDSNLPSVKGSGELRIKDNIIIADIDYSKSYLTKSGKVIYEPNITIQLDEQYSVIRGKYKPNINYLIYNPIVSGIKNKKIEKEVNIKLRALSSFKPFAESEGTTPVIITPDDILDYTYLGNFIVQFFKKNLLILDMTGYYYPFGAAHGMPYKKTPNIDLITGKFYTLGDLFMGGVYWVGELNKIINEMIKNDSQYSYIFNDSFKGIKPNQDFYIDENNLYIYFPPYEIAPYAAGFVTFKIPFTEIEGMINKEGNFYKSFH